MRALLPPAALLALVALASSASAAAVPDRPDDAAWVDDCPPDAMCAASAPPAVKDAPGRDAVAGASVAAALGTLAVASVGVALLPRR